MYELTLPELRGTSDASSGSDAPEAPEFCPNQGASRKPVWESSESDSKRFGGREFPLPLLFVFDACLTISFY